MNKENNYYNWFKKVIALFIELFFVGAILSTIYVFTYPFNGTIKIIIFIVLILFFFIVVYLLKEKVRKLLSLIIKKLEKLDYRKLLLIVIISLVLLKIIYTIFFYFDPTLRENDISIYNSIANSIYETKAIDTNSISHLLGIALHLVLFKTLSIPNHIGVFVVFLIGTVFNFISFKEYIGKEKAFLCVMLYLLMPSTILLTFCPTHELFVYLYISISLFILNKLLKENTKLKSILFTFLLVVFITLTCFVNPAGNLVNIILALIVLLSNVKAKKKILISVCLILTLVSSNMITKSLNMNEIITETNTYSILICGSSVDTNGEHVDKYPANKARDLLKSRDIKVNGNTQLEAYKEILIEQYKYLFTHPVELIKLLVHKFYVEWSGDHYSLEMAYDAGAMTSTAYYVLLAISALIYLFVITIAFVLKDKSKEYSIYELNYNLIVLGVVALLLVTLVLNKYSVYATLFIYCVSFDRIDLINKKS